MNIVKWQGGKSRLVGSILPHLLRDPILPGSGYWEPFLGSGAVLQAVLRARVPELAVYHAGDANWRLITMWAAVRDEPAEVLRRLVRLADPPDRWASVYYTIRDNFNRLCGDADRAEIAAHMIWLNRHCFNGLYRENRGGAFNVPVGRYASPPTLPNLDDLTALSGLIRGVRFMSSAYRVMLPGVVQQGDVVYLDPPYLPEHADAGMFSSYQSGGVGRADHQDLAARARQLANRGVRVVISASAGGPTHDVYVRDAGFAVAEVVPVQRTGGRSNRHTTEEWILTDGPHG